MISFCTLARDTPNLKDLVDMFKRNCPCEYEICIGDNSTMPVFTEHYKDLADVYVRIEDKELWRMGIPWGHNRVASMANTNKIFYVDSDEYPVWIHPDIEDKFDTSYVLATARFDFVSREEIMKIDSDMPQVSRVPPQFNVSSLEAPPHHQDRVYNSRYVQFDGVCHATFRCPPNFRERSPSVILLHNKTVRDAKNIDRMRDIIREQYSRMIINPALSSSDVVFGWAKQWKAEHPKIQHKFETFEEFRKAYE
jgi:hypothetical protein